MVKAVAEFLKAAARLAQSGVSKRGIENFAREEFGEISEFLQAQINNIFRKKERGILSVEKRQPIGQDGNVIEAVFKPGRDKKGKIVEESPSQKGKTFDELLAEEQSPLMKRLEGKAEGLRKGINLTTGLSRTLAREILMDKGVKISKGVDPLELLNRQYGPDIVSDVTDLADELIEMERKGEAYKDIKTILKQEGLLDIKTPGQVRTGYTPEELEEIQKAIDEEDMLLKFDTTDREPSATGGIAGIKGLLKLINKKFGKGTLKTANKIDRPKSAREKEMFEEFVSRNPDPKRQLTDDEIDDLAGEVGELDAYDFDGTVESANRIRKQYKDYMDDMYQQYRMGKLDPQPGEKGRKEFLEKKLEEMEMSGDRKLMTVDEIEELSTYDLGTQMEEFKNTKSRLQKKYKGMIDDDLLSKMMVDDNPQRLAEVEAALDQGLELLKRGKSQEEVLEIITKGINRTKHAGGGLAYLMGL